MNNELHRRQRVPASTTTVGEDPRLAAERRDRRTLRIAGGVALLAHVGLLLITLPTWSVDRIEPAAKPKVYVMEVTRWKPPEPRTETPIPRRRAHRVPVPDPTPDEPEPLRIDEPEEFVIDEIDDLPIQLPEAPPEPAGDDGPVEWTSALERPVKIFAPPPRYTELARKARIQGVVALRAVIDEQGLVTHIEALRGLPMGLTESAVETVRTWRFEPARRNGQPQAVYYTLTVNFQLQ